jgi:hypothetical protein
MTLSIAWRRHTAGSLEEHKGAIIFYSRLNLAAYSRQIKNALVDWTRLCILRNKECRWAYPYVGVDTMISEWLVLQLAVCFSSG